MHMRCAGSVCLPAQLGQLQRQAGGLEQGILLSRDCPAHAISASARSPHIPRQKLAKSSERDLHLWMVVLEGVECLDDVWQDERLTLLKLA